MKVKVVLYSNKRLGWLKEISDGYNKKKQAHLKKTAVEMP